MNRALILLVMLLAGPSAHAAGVSKTLKITVNETLLQGYTAAPPAGWTQNIFYIAASAASNPAQEVVALIYERTAGPPTTNLPGAAGISAISVSNGRIFRKFNLPVEAQVSRANCTFPNAGKFNACMSAGYTVFPDEALPDRLIVMATVPSFDTVSLSTRYKHLAYVLDTAAPIADRWTKIRQVSDTSSIQDWFATRLPDRKLYMFDRASATTTQISEVANK